MLACSIAKLSSIFASIAMTNARHWSRFPGAIARAKS
jgi:hypothetical protein